MYWCIPQIFRAAAATSPKAKPVKSLAAFRITLGKRCVFYGHKRTRIAACCDYALTVSRCLSSVFPVKCRLVAKKTDAHIAIIRTLLPAVSDDGDVASIVVNGRPFFRKRSRESRCLHPREGRQRTKRTLYNISISSYNMCIMSTLLYPFYTYHYQ